MTVYPSRVARTRSAASRRRPEDTTPGGRPTGNAEPTPPTPWDLLPGIPLDYLSNTALLKLADRLSLYPLQTSVHGQPAQPLTDASHA